ncbi:MAG: YhcH/YjgK/YiaL family protein [Candidatus Omnitrophica bacterium]|nr:YhcH/YjgK/YiaL family protein [Candidatus Omnitrophota bacterium]
MIFDQISNIGRYGLLRVAAVVAFLETYDVQTPAPREFEILGRELFVRSSAYETRSPGEGKFEAHQVYADIQVVLQGAEIMQVADPEGLAPLTAYDAAADCRFFAASKGISDILVPQGSFVMFFPGEAHRPCCHPPSGKAMVRKLVFKVRI